MYCKLNGKGESKTFDHLAFAVAGLLRHNSSGFWNMCLQADTHTIQRWMVPVLASWASPNCWILELTLLHRCFVLIGKWLAKPCNSPQQWPGGARLQDVRSSVKSSEGPWWWGANWGHPGESYLQIVLTIAAFTTISSIIMCIDIYGNVYVYGNIHIYII